MSRDLHRWVFSGAFLLALQCASGTQAAESHPFYEKNRENDHQPPDVIKRIKAILKE